MQTKRPLAVGTELGLSSCLEQVVQDFQEEVAPVSGPEGRVRNRLWPQETRGRSGEQRQAGPLDFRDVSCLVQGHVSVCFYFLQFVR